MTTLRKPLISRTTWVFAGLTIVVVGGFALLPRFVRWREHQRFAEAEQRAAPYQQEFAALAPALHDRIAPLAVVAPSMTATCPAEVRGAIPLVQQDWIAHAVGDAAEYPRGPRLNSPVFDYMAGALTPSHGDVKQLEQRNRSLRELAASKYVAVFARTGADAIKHTGEATFEGGRISGTLVVVDVAAKQALCGIAVASQPDFVISVRQSSAEAERWARESAESDATRAAFWTRANEGLARIAPGATLVTAPN